MDKWNNCEGSFKGNKNHTLFDSPLEKIKEEKKKLVLFFLLFGLSRRLENDTEIV